MYRDNSLVPSEAIRLLALGLLATEARSYADLASQVRHFTGRLVGPSLELVGQPLELLKVEGLAETAEGEEGDNALLHITESGREEFRRLMTASLRPQINDINKLIIAIKVRFLHLLDGPEQSIQAEVLQEIFERELARLLDLRSCESGERCLWTEWLELEMALTKRRLDWARSLTGAS